MICKNCGAMVNDESARFCPFCGAAMENQGAQPQNQGGAYQQPPYYQQPYYQQPAQNDRGGCLWGGLGFLIPIAGLILFLVWKNERPNTAKACGIGALVSVILAVVFSILYVILMVTVLDSMAYYMVMGLTAGLL